MSKYQEPSVRKCKHCGQPMTKYPHPGRCPTLEADRNRRQEDEDSSLGTRRDIENANQITAQDILDTCHVISPADSDSGGTSGGGGDFGGGGASGDY